MKKILCAATALILAFGLTACGSGTGAPASSGQTAAGTSAGTSASGTAAPDSAEGNENAGPGRENIAAGSAANITPGSADTTVNLVMRETNGRGGEKYAHAMAIRVVEGGAISYLPDLDQDPNTVTINAPIGNAAYWLVWY